MDKKDEIEFLMKARVSAQEIVDKITIRIVELQSAVSKTENEIGFKKE